MKKMKREVSIRKLSAEERASALDLAWRPTRNCTILIMTLCPRLASTRAEHPLIQKLIFF